MKTRKSLWRVCKLTDEQLQPPFIFLAFYMYSREEDNNIISSSSSSSDEVCKFCHIVCEIELLQSIVMNSREPLELC
jgi:hypothetical protein